MLCRCLAQFAMSRKPSQHLICSFLVKPKITSKWTYSHPHIHSKPHDSFSMTSHVSRRHPLVFGARALENSESLYYNLQFWLFLRHFWTFSDPVIFSIEIFLWLPMWLVMLRRCLAQFAMSRKASQHPHLFISRKTQNHVEMNVKTSTYVFQATRFISNDLPCPYKASCGVWSSEPGKFRNRVI